MQAGYPANPCYIGLYTYLRGDICEVSAVQPPSTRFFPTKEKRETMTKPRDTSDRNPELEPILLSFETKQVNTNATGTYKRKI